MLAGDDVASVILARNASWTDAMTLQKLLYYVQSWHLAVTGEPMFPESIKAYRDGPVVPDVRLKRLDTATRRVSAQKLDGIELDDLASDLIDLVMAKYGSMIAEELSALTHGEEPWRQARGDLPPEATGNAAISLETMAAYYRAHGRLGGRTAADLAAGGVHLMAPGATGPVDVDALLALIADQQGAAHEDQWGGANLTVGQEYDAEGIELRERFVYSAC